MKDVFNGLGVQLEALDREEFLKARETLTRMGLLTEDEKTLEQTCFILHKRGQYALMHHLELRMMDGERVEMTDEDVEHRNAVANLLDQWGLITIQDLDDVEMKAEPGSVIVIPYRDKKKYFLEPLYEIGRGHIRDD